jgi:hypothetical protein
MRVEVLAAGSTTLTGLFCMQNQTRLQSLDVHWSVALLAKKPDDVMDMSKGEFKRTDAMLLSSVPAADMGFAGIGADAAQNVRQTAPQRLAKPDKKMQFRACFVHWKLYCDQHKGLISDGGHVGMAYADMDALERCCITASAVPVATQLVLDKWVRHGESKFADSMGKYATNCGGLVPRCSANLLPGIMVPDHNCGPEGFHYHFKKELKVKRAGAAHLKQVADLVSSRSLFDQSLGYAFHKDIWCGPVFTQITKYLSLEFYKDTQHPVTINPILCSIVASMKLDALDMQKHTRAAGDPVLWNLKTDLVKQSQDVILVPTATLVGQVVLCHPYDPKFGGKGKEGKSSNREGVQGVVTSNRTIVRFVQAKCADQSPSWLRKFINVIEDPEGATSALSLNFDQFCEWSTCFDILIPVSDAAEKAEIIERLRRGIPGASTGKICNGAEIDDAAVAQHGLVKYAHAPPPPPLPPALH